MARCAGKKADGTRCRTSAMKGGKLCFFHSENVHCRRLPQRPLTAKELSVLLQRETKRFIREPNYPIKKFAEFRKSIETVAALQGIKLEEPKKEKLSFKERIEKVEKRAKKNKK